MIELDVHSTQLWDAKYVTCVLTTDSYSYCLHATRDEVSCARCEQYEQGPRIIRFTLASRHPGGEGNCVYWNLRGEWWLEWAHSLSAERAAWYGQIHGRSEFSEHVWSSGSAGPQPGQHPNHLRDPTGSLLAAQYNHQVRSGGAFNHSANNSGGRVCPSAQLRTPKSSRSTVYPQSPAVSWAHISRSRTASPHHDGLCI